MKFELKTHNEIFSSRFLHFFKSIFFLALIIILSDLTLKLGVISKQYETKYTCRILSVEKSATNFKKLSRLSNLQSKQKIWEFCREFVK